MIKEGTVLFLWIAVIHANRISTHLRHEFEVVAPIGAPHEHRCPVEEILVSKSFLPNLVNRNWGIADAFQDVLACNHTLVGQYSLHSQREWTHLDHASTFALSK